jgi:hypothetical protein
MDSGRSDLLYRMNIRTDKPSYGCQLEAGATALAEAWDASPHTSQNHCMLGHVQEWFMGGLAGIGQEGNSVGFERIVIQPFFAAEMTHASGVYRSVRGEIRSEWRRIDAGLELAVEIPAGSCARIVLPVSDGDAILESGLPLDQAAGLISIERIGSATSIEVGSGVYCFQFDNQNKGA